MSPYHCLNTHIWKPFLCVFYVTQHITAYTAQHTELSFWYGTLLMTAPIPEAAGVNQGNGSGEAPRRMTIGILALQVQN